MTTTYTARAERADGWWIVTVDEAPVFLQAFRLDQVDGLVRDALGLLKGPKVEPVGEDVEVHVVLDEPLRFEAEFVGAAREAADNAKQHADNLLQASVERLAGQGLAPRDIGTVLGVSYSQARKILRQLDEETAGTTPTDTAEGSDNPVLELFAVGKELGLDGGLPLPERTDYPRPVDFD